MERVRALARWSDPAPPERGVSIIGTEMYDKLSDRR